MEISWNNPLSKVEAVVNSADENFLELQIAGSYETFRWPRCELQKDISVGEKILLELKNHRTNQPLKSASITSIDKTAEKAQISKDPGEQRKLLESLIN